MDFLNLFLVQALCLTKFHVKPFGVKNEVQSYCLLFVSFS